ncbi:uncharacterized protein I303_103203 [Kwoniella dejecticola CBS 10117]|uniref:Uncharacterized protein n=1 Tax=Kwoniella dejecticola CBS 10117 TaxID=1296121 RepID=A0A1A6AAV7_9TREE|nr:uncharacterized protein I303_03226 [Kwoniella dejecticola CBS 10117]OBR87202.1 hypothetical protein I303_03226 [Kwoniella dejecticola CBS 10117]
MGLAQSHPRHNYDGPLFGGHYPGDFSIRRNKPPNVNKDLPPPPKSVRFGNDPPAWEFYQHRPPDENLVNTRYLQYTPSVGSGNGSGSGGIGTPPPAYGTWDEKGFTIQNQ